jgi:putative phage-type endonuclease
MINNNDKDLIDSLDNNQHFNSDQNELNNIFNTVYGYYTNDENITLDLTTYGEFKTMLIETIETFYPHLAYINEQLDEVLNIRYCLNGFNYSKIKHHLNTINFDQTFITCEDRDNFYDLHRNNKQVINKSSLTKTQLKLFNQYEYLINLPQPAQKSKEWFAKRNGMLTASNGGAAIGESHYNTIKEVLIDKIGLGPKFKENKFVYHGKKYEKVAIMIYEIIYNTKIGEFGLIQHPTISYLGASPDGISMSLTLDGKLNKYMGRMLEIKCPPSRKINNFGKIKGGICPDYYWVQVQLQLECCDLPECDFWQCHLTEPYNSEADFMTDNIDDPVHSENQIMIQNENTEILEEPPKIQIDNRIKKGAIIELLPIDKSKIPPKEPWEWYGKYIYPPTILMTPAEYKIWTTNTIKNLKTLYPELMSEYRFSRVVYWRLDTSHNELITRQPEWFDSHKADYAKFWSRVLYYRDHIDEAKEDLLGQKLSNEVFLYTDDVRIPKIKSLVQFKKSLNLPEDSHGGSHGSSHGGSHGGSHDNIFIKTTGHTVSNNFNSDDAKSDDIFLSSSDSKINQVNKSTPAIVSKAKTTPVSKKQQYLNSVKTNTTTVKPIKSVDNKKTKEDEDIFLSSDSPKQILPQKILPQKIQAKKSIQSNENLNTTISEPIPLYKNNTSSKLIDEDDVLDLVMITENRKKKNVQKNK